MHHDSKARSSEFRILTFKAGSGSGGWLGCKEPRRCSTRGFWMFFLELHEPGVQLDQSSAQSGLVCLPAVFPASANDAITAGQS